MFNHTSILEFIYNLIVIGSHNNSATMDVAHTSPSSCNLGDLTIV